MTMSKTKRSLGYLALAVASYLLFFVLVDVIYVLPSLIYGQNGPALDFNLVDCVADGIIILAFGALYYFLIHRGWKRDEGERGSVIELGWGKGLLIAAVLGLGVSGVSFLWLAGAETFLSGIGFVRESLEMLAKSNESFDGGIIFFQVLLICVVGPIMEELLFRGLICGSLERATKVSWIPIVVSAVVFGIWHGIFVQSVYTCLMGLVVAYVYHRTHDLRWPILIHVVNNSFSMLLTTPAFAALGPIPNVFTAVMIVPSAYVLYRMMGGKDSGSESAASRRDGIEAV